MFTAIQNFPSRLELHIQSFSFSCIGQPTIYQWFLCNFIDFLTLKKKYINKNKNLFCPLFNTLNCKRDLSAITIIFWNTSDGTLEHTGVACFYCSVYWKNLFHMAWCKEVKRSTFFLLLFLKEMGTDVHYSVRVIKSTCKCFSHCMPIRFVPACLQFIWVLYSFLHDIRSAEVSHSSWCLIPL